MGAPSGVVHYGKNNCQGHWQGLHATFLRLAKGGVDIFQRPNVNELERDNQAPGRFAHGVDFLPAGLAPSRLARMIA